MILSENGQKWLIFGFHKSRKPGPAVSFCHLMTLQICGQAFRMSLSLSFLCLFSLLQYLGLVEVEESRGMHVCEEAVKKLKMVSISSLFLFSTISTTQDSR